MSIVSDVDIANRALGDCGVASIDSFSDNSKQARVIEARYAQVRDALLRSHFWNFAKQRAVLPALVTPPAFGFCRQFPLPANCLRLWELHGAPDYAWYGWSAWHRDRQEFQVEGDAILSDHWPPLYIVYVAQIIDPTLFDALFVDAFAAALASNVCMPLTKDNALRQQLEQTASGRLAMARGVNNIENGHRSREATDILRVRF